MPETQAQSLEARRQFQKGCARFDGALPKVPDALAGTHANFQRLLRHRTPENTLIRPGRRASLTVERARAASIWRAVDALRLKCLGAKLAETTSRA